MRLSWHDYRYFPYERDLARRELCSLVGVGRYRDTGNGIELAAGANSKRLARLTYFAGYMNGSGYLQTIQSRLEEEARGGKCRQATRYSSHGLHEYKGKFNPQIAKAILNIFGVAKGDAVLDPFCGSGTTLLECAHSGINGYGIDLNPLAVFVANAKLLAAGTPARRLRTITSHLTKRFRQTRRWNLEIKGKNARAQYLRSWFDDEILRTIEVIRHEIDDIADSYAPIFLSIGSNLLRDYSLQDPNDLRIRRRSSPLPSEPFTEVFLAACSSFVERIEAAQAVLGCDVNASKAILGDVTSLPKGMALPKFDAAITSPPYATALPYIDTQRLSLIWLQLLMPDQMAELEATLIGSREVRGGRSKIQQELLHNEAGLPEAQHKFCVSLKRSLSETDGFRRQAVPAVLYRYFGKMKSALTSVRSVVKPKARFALVIGHNHTTLGGRRFDIDTPAHLADLAIRCGWSIEELVPLQTYQRYGYHVSNSVAAETLVLLRTA